MGRLGKSCFGARQASLEGNCTHLDVFAFSSTQIVMTLGFGLLINLDGSSSRAKEVIYQLVAAAGVGCLFQTPMIALQAAMPLKDMAVATGTLGLMR